MFQFTSRNRRTPHKRLLSTRSILLALFVGWILIIAKFVALISEHNPSVTVTPGPADKETTSKQNLSQDVATMSLPIWVIDKGDDFPFEGLSDEGRKDALQRLHGCFQERWNAHRISTVSKRQRHGLKPQCNHSDVYHAFSYQRSAWRRQSELNDDDGNRRGDIDVVYSFVNGSAPGFYELWRVEALSALKGILLRNETKGSTESPFLNSDGGGLEEVLTSNLATSELVQRMTSTIRRLHSSLGIHASSSNPDSKVKNERVRTLETDMENNLLGLLFSPSRFRDWGELFYSLKSLSNCVDSYRRWLSGGSESHNDPPLPISGKVFIVVSDANQVSAEWIRHLFPSLQVVIVTHDTLLSRAQAARVGQGRLYNSNAIETLLHHIPKISEWFVYFNNDMLWGRCPRWLDYLRPLDVTTTSVRYVPNVFGEHLDLGRSSIQTTVADDFIATQHGIINNSFPIIGPRLGFAHYPRMFHVHTLALLLDKILAQEVSETRRRFLSRTSRDVWVPYLYDHFVSRPGATSLKCESGNERDVVGEDRFVICLHQFQGVYFFVMLNGLLKMEKTHLELQGIKARALDPSREGGPLEWAPLFVTLNDDMSLTTSHPSGGDDQSARFGNERLVEMVRKKVVDILELITSV